MTGLIWFVQVVHYPLFAFVQPDTFKEYEARHTGRTTIVVGPVMLVELGCSLALLGFRPAPVPLWAVWTGVLLLAVIWLSTFFISVPCHSELAKGFNPRAARALVRTNWIRTFAWTLRALLAMGMVFYWTPAQAS